MEPGLTSVEQQIWFIIHLLCYQPDITEEKLQAHFLILHPLQLQLVMPLHQV